MNTDSPSSSIDKTKAITENLKDMHSPKRDDLTLIEEKLKDNSDYAEESFEKFSSEINSSPRNKMERVDVKQTNNDDDIRRAMDDINRDLEKKLQAEQQHL